MVRVAEGSATKDWEEKGLEEVVAEVVVAGVRVEAELQAQSQGCKECLEKRSKEGRVRKFNSLRISGW